MKIFKYRISPEELSDLAIALGALILSAIIATRSNPLSPFSWLLLILPLILGFSIHELAHKFMAQYMGYYAVFKTWKDSLMITILLSFTGFFFAAPGAVYSLGVTSMNDSGKISLAGPVSNIIMAILAMSCSFILGDSGYLGLFFIGMEKYNLALAFFNLLPIPPLDGYTIMKWDKAIWAFALVFTIFLQIF